MPTTIKKKAAEPNPHLTAWIEDEVDDYAKHLKKEAKKAGDKDFEDVTDEQKEVAVEEVRATVSDAFQLLIENSVENIMAVADEEDDEEGEDGDDED